MLPIKTKRCHIIWLNGIFLLTKNGTPHVYDTPPARSNSATGSIREEDNGFAINTILQPRIRYVAKESAFNLLKKTAFKTILVTVIVQNILRHIIQRYPLRESNINGVYVPAIRRKMEQ